VLLVRYLSWPHVRFRCLVAEEHGMNNEFQDQPSISVRIRCQEFAMPPVRDAIVLGKNSPIGCEAMRKALMILQPTQFEHIELADKDDVIGDLLVRSSILKKIPVNKFVEPILKRLKPLMASDECLHLDVTSELMVDEQL
jgi:hypothetical protein